MVFQITSKNTEIRSKSMSVNLSENDENAVPEQEETKSQINNNDKVDDDPFFGTGHFSMHQQPEDEDIFIGE